MGHHTPARRLLRALGAAAPLAAAGGCEYLSFAKMLRPPAFTGARGHRSTDRGPAYAPAAALPAAADPAADWGSYNNAPDGTRWSPLAQVTAANVAGLRRACALDLGERTPMQSGPVVVGGVLYVTSAKRTWAMDAATCRLRWQHTYAYHPKPAFDLKTNRGVAYVTADDGRGGRRPLLVRGANDGRVYAVDARTGREVWNVGAGDPGRGETFPAAPVAWTPPGGRPLVFLGNAGGDNYAVTGRLMAFDAATGSRVWSFDFVPRAGAAAGTWPAETDSVPRAGATTWTTYTLDTLAGTVYVPTGNASPNFLPQLRPGTNDHTNSVVALDARTGAFRRAYKVLALDSHDYDVAAAPVLLAPGGGAPVVAVAGKDGYLHAFDRDGGRRLWASPTTTLLNDTVAPTPEGVRFCPGCRAAPSGTGRPTTRRRGRSSSARSTGAPRCAPRAPRRSRGSPGCRGRGARASSSRSGAWTRAATRAAGWRRSTRPPGARAGASARRRRWSPASRPPPAGSPSRPTRRGPCTPSTRAPAPCAGGTTPGCRWGAGWSRTRSAGASTWPWPPGCTRRSPGR
jgi:outer membrane protein assembly factor BamB